MAAEEMARNIFGIPVGDGALMRVQQTAIVRVSVAVVERSLKATIARQNHVFVQLDPREYLSIAGNLVRREHHAALKVPEK